jgi:hypothetical protein
MDTNIDKDEIAKRRARSGHFEIGDETDGGIKEMRNLNGRLLVIKERAIYEVVFADTIDPERNHSNTPHQVQKKIVALGTESQLASKTLLMSLKLMKPEYIKPEVDVDRALQVVQEMLVELNQLNTERDSFLTAEKSEVNDYENRKVNNLDYKLPSIPDILTRCKTFFQKADHVLQTISELDALFFTERKLNIRAKTDTFREMLVNLYGEDDTFVKFIDQVSNFILLLRNIRDCLEHRLDEISIIDFERQVNNDVLTPTISINFRKSKLDRHPLNDMLQQTTTNLLYIVETSIAMLCDKKVRTDKNFRYYLRQIPAKQRVNKHIKYAFWMPIGPDGFYLQ